MPRMVDVTTLLINFLNLPANNTFVKTPLGGESNVFGTLLPKGIAIGDGKKAIVVSQQGGDSHPEIPDWFVARVQFTAWANSAPDARDIYRFSHDLLHGLQNVSCGADGFLASCIEVVSGQSIVDPDTGWFMFAGFYHVTVRPS